MLNGVTAVEELTVSQKDAEGPEKNLRKRWVVQTQS